MPTQLTIRGVTDDLNRRLTRLGKSTGQSVNTVALRILEDAVGIDARRQRLERYMTWSKADLAECDAALKGQREIDHDLWSQERTCAPPRPRHVRVLALSRR